MAFGFLRRNQEKRFFRKALVLQRDDPEHFKEILETMRSSETMRRVTGYQGEEHFRDLGWSAEDAEVAAVAAFLLAADHGGMERV